MAQISDIKQLHKITAQLPSEYAVNLSNWWRRAQKPNKPYAIEYTNKDDLMRQIDEHIRKAEQRSESRKKRVYVQHPDTKRKSSIEEKCFTAVCQLADVRGITVDDIIRELHEQAEEAKEQARENVEAERKELMEKMQAFRNKHIEIITEFEAMEAEEKRLQERAGRLNVTIKQRKENVKTQLLF